MVTVLKKDKEFEFDFKNYLPYEEFISMLMRMAGRYPELLELRTLGKTKEGREIPLLVVTNREKAPDDKKPALWIGANIHGRELPGGIVALGFVLELIQRYDLDAEVRTLLDRRAFYVAPRLAPDAVERALQSNPRFLRSGGAWDQLPLSSGWIIQDVDMDGRILWLRWLSPTGAFKPSPQDPRLLVRRDPDDRDGPFYHLLPEGRWLDEPFHTPEILPPSRVDLNRNFPTTLPRVKPEIAGFYPTSEPEVRAVVDFLSHHPNIYAAVDLHSYGGVILRPFSYSPDEAIPFQDLRIYKEVGEKGEAFTGYPSLSTYHGFRSSPEDTIYGAFDDWFYEYLGGLGFTVEIFSPQRLAGIETKNVIQWLLEHPFEEDLKMLAMVDRFFAGEGYVPWYPFSHPQLGQVEIGGWNVQLFFAPPPDLFSSELPGIYRWFCYLAHLAPELEISHFSLRPLDGGVYALDLTVQNRGYLPTYGLTKAIDRGLSLAPVLNLKVPVGVKVLNLELPYPLPHLEGFGRFPRVIYEEAPFALKLFKGLRILLHSPGPFEGEVILSAPRAGEVRSRFRVE